MKLCSACLLGKNCRYDGTNKRNEKVVELSKTEELVSICPEELGGLETPREPAEIQNDGKIRTKSGEDATEKFIKGAEETLRIVKENNIREAILKQGSPSCGCGKIYDGTFSGKLIEGDGVVTRLLKKNGVIVITEEDLQS